MRTFALAIALALVASPALAHHKPNHPEIGAAQQSRGIEIDPCGAAYSPHVQASERALMQRCQALRAELARRPGDADVRARCDRAALALTGRPCGEPARASARDR